MHQLRLNPLAAMGFCALVAHAQPCEPHWSKDFPASILRGNGVLALTVYDDGSGPRVFAGGDFVYYSADGAGGYFGRWDGPLWEKVGGVYPSGPVTCMAVWDDPNSPGGDELYIGGQFHGIGDEPVRYVAKWDGKVWSYLDTGLNHYPAKTFVDAMAVYDDGTGPSLYAAGSFNRSGDLSRDLLNIARWDGERWHDVGGGLVRAEQPDLTFVRSLAVYDDGAGPALYAGGLFTLAGDVPVGGIARWDGAEWSAVGEPLLIPWDNCPSCTPAVRAMIAFDDGTGPALWVAGDIQAPGVGTKWTARFRDGQWESAGAIFGHRNGYPNGPPINEMNSLAVLDLGDGPALYAGGRFETYDPPKDDLTGGCLARWDPGTQMWIDLDANPYVRAVTAYDDGGGPRIWAGGNFGRAGGGPNGAIASLGPDGWQRIGPAGLFSQPTHIAAYDDGNDPAVYVGGSFQTIGDLGWAHGIARWTRDGWENVGDWGDINGATQAIVGGSSKSMTVIDLGDGPMLYTPAELYTEKSVAFRGIVRWDGSHWSTVGQDMDISPNRVFAYDHGAGNALHLTTHTNADIYRLEDGVWTLWADATGGAGALGPTIEFDDGSGPALWVCGDFTSIEGVQANYLARYRPGSGWERLSEEMSGPVWRLAVWNDGNGPALYASGPFTKAGGKVVNSIARWDGTAWHPLAGGLKGGFDGVASVGAYPWDDGSGSALYAFGTFTSADGEPMSHIAKWDGKAWSALDIGTGNSVEDLAGIDLGSGPTLFATGVFHYAGGYPSPGFAAWVPCASEPCPADLDGDGSLDLFDFLMFVNLLSAEDPAADCDGDGALTPADFTCYAALFAAGCP